MDVAARDLEAIADMMAAAITNPQRKPFSSETYEVGTTVVIFGSNGLQESLLPLVQTRVGPSYQLSSYTGIPESDSRVYTLDADKYRSLFYRTRS